MAATKTFNIGECAIGGRIQVNIQGKIIEVKALDWNTKKPVQTGTHQTDCENSRYVIKEFLEDLTTYYHAEKIFEWIESKVKIGPTFDW